MIIDKIVLHDFGVYAGLQNIDLTPPSLQKPIILFSGLNGTGKTTMLDALQLCLYGPVAKCSNRNGQSYQDYLQGSINKYSQWRQASVGIHFRHTLDGHEASYILRRTWKLEKKKLKEDFDVYKDSVQVPSIAKNWLQQIEEIMPANIAHLFFFDGEQIENYATQKHSSALIETAIVNLLGLDIVEQLDKDLRTLERRTQVESLDKSDQDQIGNIKLTLEHLHSKIAQIRQEKAELQTHTIDRLQREYDRLEENFRKLGGELYEQRAQIEQNATQAYDELANCTLSLQELASGCLPFVFVQHLLEKIQQRDTKEQKMLATKSSYETIKKRDLALMKYLQEHNAKEAVLDLIKQFNIADLQQRTLTATGTIENEIDAQTRLILHSLISEKLVQESNSATMLMHKYENLKTKTNDTDFELASIPEHDTIKDLLTNRTELKNQIDAAYKRREIFIAEIERTEREMNRQESALQDLLQAKAELRVQFVEKDRILKHSSKARQTLSQFRNDVILSHIQAIETLVLDSYQNLLRKKSLVANISIDPDDFSLKLFDIKHRHIPTERLSAGERQLLAIALLWGMAKSSGRPLPTAIDTPLSRLDASHRKHLVERYFPFASHQVLLFSTDQELHGQYLQAIKSQIGRNYFLDFEDKTGITRIKEGYLPS